MPATTTTTTAAAAPTTFCPFKAPTRGSAAFGGALAHLRRFDQRPGMSLVCAEFECSQRADPQPWPADAYVQILFVADGALAFGGQDGALCELQPGEWLIVKPQIGGYRFRPQSPVELLWIECDAVASQSLVGYSDSISQQIQVAEKPLFATGVSAGRLQSLGQELARSKGDSPRERLLVESKTLEWLALLLDHPVFSPCRAVVPKRNVRDEAALRAAARILESRLDENHSIAQLSRAVHLNEFKLKKGFRERYDTTVIGYLRQKRMEKARELLASGSQSVIEVANAVGYSNPSHFARAFREAFGTNPSAFG